jgi:hypothetical protein
MLSVACRKVKKIVRPVTEARGNLAPARVPAPRRASGTRLGRLNACPTLHDKLQTFLVGHALACRRAAARHLRVYAAAESHRPL